MLAEATSLLDIDDVDGYIAATINRSGLSLGFSEREELHDEALVLLYELAAVYRPRMNGHSADGSFAGYAASILPNRLGDAWHKSHPEHQRVAANGSRHWRYGEPAIALDDPDHLEGEGLLALFEPEATDRVERALELIEPFERFGVRRMVALVEEGFGWGEIAGELDVSRLELGGMRERLRAALAEVER